MELRWSVERRAVIDDREVLVLFLLVADQGMISAAFFDGPDTLMVTEGRPNREPRNLNNVNALTRVDEAALAAEQVAAAQRRAACETTPDVCEIFQGTISMTAEMDPLLRAEMLARIAQAYGAHFRVAEAQFLMADALALAANDLDSPQAQTFLTALATAQYAAQQTSEVNETLGLIIDPADAASSYRGVITRMGLVAGLASSGQASLAARWFDDAMSIARAADAPEAEQMARAMTIYMSSLASAGMADQALELARFITEQGEDLFGVELVLDDLAEHGLSFHVQALIDLYGAENLDARDRLSAPIVAAAMAGDLEAVDGALADLSAAVDADLAGFVKRSSASAIAEARARAGDIDGALALLDLFSEEAFPLRGEVLGRIAVGLAARGEIDRATSMLAEARLSIAEAPFMERFLLTDLAVAFAHEGQAAIAADLLNVIAESIDGNERLYATEVMPAYLAVLVAPRGSTHCPGHLFVWSPGERAAAVERAWVRWWRRRVATVECGRSWRRWRCCSRAARTSASIRRACP